MTLFTYELWMIRSHINIVMVDKHFRITKSKNRCKKKSSNSIIDRRFFVHSLEKYNRYRCWRTGTKISEFPSLKVIVATTDALSYTCYCFTLLVLGMWQVKTKKKQ